ncbi:DUF4172 domain-containing protein [Pseudomonas sp. B10(2017)]|nr:DUF4172 domain-containing protein [Pseudomonas sp. B10(2017)]
MNSPLWIWQQPAWPRFTWQNEAIAPMPQDISNA